MARAVIPTDDDRAKVQLVPSKTALAVTVDDTISTATDVSLNASTTFLEVSAVNAGIYMRYAASAAANAFDEYIMANTTRHFYVPSGVTVISVIQDASVGTAFCRIIEK